MLCPEGIYGDAKCFSPQDVKEAHLQRVHDVESNEIIASIPIRGRNTMAIKSDSQVLAALPATLECPGLQTGNGLRSARAVRRRLPFKF